MNLNANNTNIVGNSMANKGIKMSKNEIQKSKGIGLVGIVLIIILFVVLGIGGCGIGQYNGMKRGNNAVDKAAGNIDADLVRRNDLIPNLVNVTKAYMTHEKGIFTEIADLRSRIGQTNISLKDANIDPAAMQQFMGMQNQLGGALSKLVVAVENYPELKANETVRMLMDELAGTENRIKVSRTRYNDAVELLNNKIDVFPGNIIAGMFNIKRREMFEAPEAAKAAPVVEL